MPENNVTAADNIKDIMAGLPYMEMGTGFLIGLGVGYFLKKSFKILLLLLGLVVALIFVLQHQHIVTLNQDGLAHTVDEGASAFKHFAIFLKSQLASLKIAGSASAVAGFLVGLKMG